MNARIEAVASDLRTDFRTLNHPFNTLFSQYICQSEAFKNNSFAALALQPRAEDFSMPAISLRPKGKSVARSPTVRIASFWIHRETAESTALASHAGTSQSRHMRLAVDSDYASPVPWSVWMLAILCTLPELVLLGSDWGLWGSMRWRWLAYTQGAFWAGLWYGWTPNYALQPATMVLSHAWLHAGPMHLAGNLAALLWLGPQVAARRGNGGLLIFWCLAALGGGIAFGLLSSSPAPMVGASGALFGLSADWVVAEVRQSRGRIARLSRAVMLAAFLLALNAAVWALQGGQVAWETHLGGFLVGLVLAVSWRAR